MSRYRLEPTPAQEQILLRHCSDARYVWNLCVEQQSWWRFAAGHAVTARGHSPQGGRLDREPQHGLLGP